MKQGFDMGRGTFTGNRKFMLNDPWVWRMAWRDARHHYARLLLFVASLTTGIAGVVSLDALNHSLKNEVDRNAKELLGADVVVSGSRKFEEELVELFDSTGLPRAMEADMASMVYFKNSQGSRLIRLVALEGPFPFYGQLKTLPDGAYEKMKKGGYALLDGTLASAYAVRPGDSLKIGNRVFSVAGTVVEFPGGGGILATFTPSIYISMDELASTGLVQYGSRVNYKHFFKTESEKETKEVVARLKPRVKEHGHSVETVESRKEGLGRTFMSVYRFFSLLAFVALILGAIGIASSVHIYVREKRDEVAVLRCMGSSGWRAFHIFFIQVMALGLLASFIGGGLGLGIQYYLPSMLKGVFPIEIQLALHYPSLFMGVGLGTVVSVVFSLLPLVSIRNIPPLVVLRADFQPSNQFSWEKSFLVLSMALFPLASASWLSGSWIIGLWFTLGLGVALAFMLGISALLLRLLKKHFPNHAPFVWRHALSNLYRPNNQTRIMLVTLGLGTFMVSTLNVIEKSLLAQVEFTGQKNQSNTILFDIQPHQVEGVLGLMKENELKPKQVVPIVTCRLSEIKGRSVAEWQKDTTDKVANWALTREYRVTYRDTLHRSEELVKGEIQHVAEGMDSVWVTLSDGMEDDLGITLGDSLVFDIQGLPVKARIAGIRKVEWPKDPPNFIFVFPMGVLENAPRIFVASTRVDNVSQANRFQQRLVTEFPNVSLIDLRLILGTVNDLFNKLRMVVRFLALFSIVTGLIVLAGAVINSKYVRIRENALLRTVGAKTAQISAMTLIEYLYIGFFASLSGILLSIASGFLLARFFFDIPFGFDPIEMILIGGGVVGMTVLMGWWNSRGAVRVPPLQVLRRET